MRPLLPNAPLLRAAILGLAHALLLILAFPPVFFPFAALLIPLPALLATRIDEKPKRVALVFGLATAPAWVFFHRWLIDVTLAGYPFLVLVLCLYATLFVLAAQRAKRVLPWWLAAPLAWTAIEFFRGQIAFEGYPWYLTAQPMMGNTAESWLLLSGPLSFFGVYGTGLLVALACSCVMSIRSWFSLRPRAVGPALALIGVGTAFWLGAIERGRYLSNEPPSRGAFSIATIQTNIPQDNKIAWTIDQRISDFQDFVSLTRSAAESNPQLIVWPETMFPGGELDPASLATMRAAKLAYPDGRPATWFADQLLALQSELNIPMLVGAIAHDNLNINSNPDGSITYESSAQYNSAILITDGKPQQQRYDKIHLTPFGEVMPYLSWSDWLEAKLISIGADGMTFNLSAGTDPTVFEVDGFRFATPICFEATMPNVCRRLAYKDGTRRVDALIQLTNDGWFGPYAGGREMHFLLARCRAVELGVPIIRAANTGISAFIRADGGFFYERAAWSDGISITELPLEIRPPPLYGRYLGDSPAWIAFAGTLTAVAFSFRRKKTPAEPAPAPETAA